MKIPTTSGNSDIADWVSIEEKGKFEWNNLGDKVSKCKKLLLDTFSSNLLHNIA